MLQLRNRQARSLSAEPRTRRELRERQTEAREGPEVPAVQLLPQALQRIGEGRRRPRRGGG